MKNFLYGHFNEIQEEKGLMTLCSGEFTFKRNERHVENIMNTLRNIFMKIWYNFLNSLFIPVCFAIGIQQNHLLQKSVLVVDRSSTFRR
jgi:hypothetical protein